MSRYLSASQNWIWPLRSVLSIAVLASIWFGATPVLAAGPQCNVPGTYSTIQAAINDSGCGFIVVGFGQFNENLTISREVTIAGLGANLSTIAAAAPGSSVIQTRNSAPGQTTIVTLQGLKITGGHADLGGGLNNVGATVLLSNVAITGNRADTGGGGIYNAGGGKLSLSASSVTGNSSGLGGGGIYNTAALSSSLFDHVPSEGEVANEFLQFVQTFPDLFAGGTNFVEQFQVVPFDLFRAFKR